MKRSIGMWQLMGFAVTTLGGTLLHFLYEWTGESIWVAPFSGVNESTWEHMKLLFWPMLMYAVIQRVLFKDVSNFWCIKLRGALLGLALIPIIFYTYNGVIGKSPDWVNIAIFFVSAAAVFIFENKLFNTENLFCPYQKISIIALSVIAVLFFIFTFYTPSLGIFRDPINGSTGI